MIQKLTSLIKGKRLLSYELLKNNPNYDCQQNIISNTYKDLYKGLEIKRELKDAILLLKVWNSHLYVWRRI